MINYLKGILVHKNPVEAIIETASGLAFEVRIPISTFEVLPEPGKPCQLFTHLHIGQDDVRLFGFATQPECALYKEVTKVSGVGPKIALSILSTLSIPVFVRAVERGEAGLLTKVPGIGQKSAQRLTLELKDRVSHLAEQFGPQDQTLPENAILEVESALESLGFNAKDVRRELALMPEAASSLSSELLIKEVIKRLYQRNK